jgi:NAD(P)-dependent dehydrogenase (short-subunit alcohol dehydrogenase family)
MATFNVPCNHCGLPQHVLCAVACSKAAAKQMVAQNEQQPGRGGSIITMSSVNAGEGYNCVMYSLSCVLSICTGQYRLYGLSLGHV